MVSTIKKKTDQLGNQVMQDSEALVRDYLERMKLQNKNKKIKVADNKQEVYEFFLRARIKLGIWIMSYEQGGIRHNPVDFQELDFMSDLPKSLFNNKMYMVVKQFSENYLDAKDFSTKMPTMRIIHKIFDVQCYKHLQETRQ